MDKSVLIVEDEPLIAQDLSYILGDIGLSKVAIAMSFEDAVEMLSSTRYDLVLLDINLSSEHDGIELAEYINEKIHCPFIFITSYYNETTVARAKVTQPLAYLLKPFNQHDIRINVEMALHKLNQEEPSQTIYLREKSGTFQLSLPDILVLEAQDNYTKVVTREKELIISQTLKSLLAKLPAESFVRTHKSFAVRLDGISMIKGGNVFIEDYKIPIGRAYKSAFQSRIALL